jgi:hypothetical protein
MAKQGYNFKPLIRKLNKWMKNQLRGGNIFYATETDLNWLNIIILLLIFILIIVFVLYLFGVFSSKESGDCTSDRGCLILSEPKDTKIPYIITSDNLPSDNSGIGYTLTVWLYVKSSNFDKQTQKFKSVLYRGSSKSHNGFQDDQFTVQPGIWLYGNTNKLLIRWNTSGRVCNLVSCNNLQKPCTPGNRCRDTDNSIKYCNKNSELTNENISMYSMNPDINPPNKACSAVITPKDILWNTSDANLDNETCIDNIPLDRWFQLGLVMHSQSIDIYVDGKLYSTFVLNSLPAPSDNANLILSRDNSPFYRNLNGFYGAVNQLRYFSYPLSPQELLRVYSWGPQPYVHESTKLGQSNNNATKTNNDPNIPNGLGSDNY